MSKIIKYQEINFYNIDPEKLLIQCKNEEELTKKICSIIKKAKEKENKLFNKFLFIAFPSILIVFYILLYTIKHLNQLSVMTVFTLLGCVLACGYIPYSISIKYWFTLNELKEKEEKAYKIALVLWAKEKMSKVK